MHAFMPMSGSQDAGGHYTRCSFSGCTLSPGQHPDPTTFPAPRTEIERLRDELEAIQSAYARYAEIAARRLDELTAEVDRLTKEHADCTNLSHAEAARIFEEAREMREQRDALMLVAHSAEALVGYASGIEWKGPCQGPIRLAELCDALDAWHALAPADGEGAG